MGCIKKAEVKLAKIKYNTLYICIKYGNFEVEMKGD